MRILQSLTFDAKIKVAGILLLYGAYGLLAGVPARLAAADYENPAVVSLPSKLTTDRARIEPRDKNRLAPLFQPLYVVRGRATDCSFVSAFMLMVKHDPDYPYKILKSDGDGHIVNFPGLDAAIKVSKEARERFIGVIDRENAARHTANHGYTPPGMEILRAAYYDYQRNKGLRPPQYAVYTGGQPIQDLMVLSGVDVGGEIVAVQGYTDIPPERISFATGLEQKIHVRLINGLFNFKNDGFSDEMADPFAGINNDLSSYLVSVSSVRKIGFFAKHFGKKIIENHAYYFLGMDADDNYILGDSYNTKTPVHIAKQEFLEKFNGIYYVKISAD